MCEENKVKDEQGCACSLNDKESSAHESCSCDHTDSTEDKPKKKKITDAAIDAVDRIVTDPKFVKTVEDVMDFAKESADTVTDYVKNNKKINKVVDTVKESGDQAVQFVKTNEQINKAVDTVKEATVKGVDTVMSGVDAVVTHPKVASAIDTARLKSADAIEYASKKVVDWLKNDEPKNKFVELDNETDPASEGEDIKGQDK